MKRYSCFLLTLVLLMTLSLPAFADGAPGMPPAPPDGANGAPGMPPDGDMPGGPGGSSADIDYVGAVEITSADAQSGQTYASTTTDESALLISTGDAVEPKPNLPWISEKNLLVIVLPSQFLSKRFGVLLRLGHADIV